MNRYLAALDRRLEQRGELVYLQRIVGTTNQSFVQCAIPAIVRALTVEQLIGDIAQQNFFLIISPTHINRQQWPGGSRRPPPAGSSRRPIRASLRQATRHAARRAEGGAARRAGVRCRRVHPDRADGAGLAMPSAPPRACRCGALVPAGKPCPRCTKAADRARGTARRARLRRRLARVSRALLPRRATVVLRCRLRPSRPSRWTTHRAQGRSRAVLGLDRGNLHQHVQQPHSRTADVSAGSGREQRKGARR